MKWLNDINLIDYIFKEVVKNKRTGQTYKSKIDFDKDVKDPTTSTKSEDFQQDVEITVASLTVFGKTKK